MLYTRRAVNKLGNRFLANILKLSRFELKLLSNKISQYIFIYTRNQPERCLNKIDDWMSCNKLKLNSDKTEFLTLKTKFQPPTLI